MKHLFLSIIFLTAPFLLKAQSLQFGKSYRLYPSNVSQTEVFIASHPTNSNILFSSANTYSFSPMFFVSEGIYVSTNGGQAWFGSDTCKGGPQNTWIYHGGDPGIAIDKNGTFVITRLGKSPFSGLYSHYSTNNGLTWSGQFVISFDNLERAATISDVVASSNYFGRTYSAWVKISGSNNLVNFSFTSNGGQSWSVPATINNPSLRNVGGEIAIGPDGSVCICWACAISTSPYTETNVGFAYSTNGGTNWIVSETAFSMNGIQGLLSQKENIRVNGLPKIDIDKTNGSRKGWIYIVTTQKNLSPAGTDPDIILNRSTNRGQTWSAGIRVNQDAINNGKIQYFPAIHVDETGAINIIYYDDRNTTSDSTGLFLSRSTDGGDNWNDYQISDHNFKPSPIAGVGQGYQGDNISLGSANKTLFPVWMDNSTGIYQVWSSQIKILTDIKNENDLSLNNFELYQNFPNPFSANNKALSGRSSSTLIKYKLEEKCFVSLKVFDMLGKEILTLVNEEKEAGIYTSEIFDFALRNISGIYFYKLESASKTGKIFRDVKKITFLK